MDDNGGGRDNSIGVVGGVLIYIYPHLLFILGISWDFFWTLWSCWAGL